MSGSGSGSSNSRGRNRILHRSGSGSSNVGAGAASNNNTSNNSINPIGVSRHRQSSRQQQHEQQSGSAASAVVVVVQPPRERRSQSLTRFVSNNIVGGDRGGGGGARRRRSFQQQTQEGGETLHDVNDHDDQLQQQQQQQQQQQLTNRQRSSSLSSFHHHQSSSSSSPAELLHEPGWFSHAFHGSGACTCSLLAGSHQLEDHHHPALSPTPVDENTNGDAAKIDGNNDHGDNNNNRGNNTNNDTTEMECNHNDDHERNDIVDGSTVVEVRRQMESCGDETKRREEEIGSRDDTKVTKEEDATTEWEWNDNIRVHDIHEVVNHHHHHPTPSTAFSDDPSLLSSSLSSSSCASNNNEQKHHNNDNNKYINDELITKVGDLAEENGVLMNKCKMLEEELSVMMTKQKPPTMMQKEEQHSLDDCENNSNSSSNNNNNKAMMFMAAISTTMMESFRVGNANLRNLSYLLSTATSTTNHHPSLNTPIDQLIESTAAVTITTNSDITMKPITEMTHEEVLEMIQDMQTENDALHKSMKDSMLSAFSDVREQMATMIESHNTTVEEYTSQVNSLRWELNAATSARDALASEIITLKNENTSMAIRVEEAMEEVATEFGAKIATLTNDLNESNLSQHELSKDMELLKKENHKLSMELEEARSLVIASVHDEMKQELLSKDTRNSENEEQALEMERLKNDNITLQESVKEMKSLIATLINKLSEESASLKDAQESYEQQGEELNVEKMANTYLREEIDCISTEREEAYDACKVLQQEINLLRQKCAKLDEERFDSDDSIPSSASDGNITSSNNEDKLSELSKMNESLTKELEHKNEALQAVQSVLTSLKEEQSIIKKTITELRTENAALRDTSTSPKTKTNSLPPLVPPPPPKSTSLKHKTSLDSSSESTSSSTQSQILQLEVRLQKVEKENKGLREANNIMSTKLFDEMEKTESLKIANEGLGARICKLVKFIQQNSGGGSCAGEGAASSVVGASISGKSR